MSEEKCPCGELLHYPHPPLREFVERMIDTFGPTQAVTRAGRTWVVPRHFTALHGLRNLPQDAARYGFEEVL